MVLARGAANIADQFFGWYPRGWDGGFLAHLHSPWGYDEPEILRYSNRQFGPIGADAGQNQFGSDSNYIDAQVRYNKAKVDAMEGGLGALIDADLAKESAKLQSLQIRQQLGTQALSISNQAPQTLLSLFR